MNDASPSQPAAPLAAPVPPLDAAARTLAPEAAEGYAMLRGVLDAGYDAFAIARAVRAPGGEIADFVIVEVNARACEMAGRTREDLIGRPLMEMFPNSRAWKLWEQLCAVVLTQRPFEITQHAPIPAEPDRWLQRQLVPLPGETVAISSRDITQRHRAQRALEVSETRFRQLFENPSVVQLMVQRDTAQIVDANAAAERFYGWSRTTLCTMTLTDLAAVDLAQWRSDIRAAATGAAGANASAPEIGPIRLPADHWVASGERRAVDVLVGHVAGTGVPTLHCVVLERQAAAMRGAGTVTAVDLASPDESASKVVSSIGHDLNNLLTVIRAAATFLRDGVSDAPQAAGLLDDVSAIERATDRAESLTRRLLAASRRPSAPGEVVDILPVVQQWLEMQLDVWPAGTVVLDAMSTAAPAMVDPMRVRDMADSLVRQARFGGASADASHVVTLHTGVELITPPEWYVAAYGTGSAPRRMAILRVRDPQPMDAALASRLAAPRFDPESRDRLRELELAVAHTLVRQTGGFLSVQRDDNGTTLRAHWPAA